MTGRVHRTHVRCVRTCVAAPFCIARKLDNLDHIERYGRPRWPPPTSSLRFHITQDNGLYSVAGTAVPVRLILSAPQLKNLAGTVFRQWFEQLGEDHNVRCSSAPSNKFGYLRNP